MHSVWRPLGKCTTLCKGILPRLPQTSLQSGVSACVIGRTSSPPCADNVNRFMPTPSTKQNTCRKVGQVSSRGFTTSLTYCMRRSLGTGRCRPCWINHQTSVSSTTFRPARGASASCSSWGSKPASNYARMSAREVAALQESRNLRTRLFMSSSTLRYRKRGRAATLKGTVGGLTRGPS